MQPGNRQSTDILLLGSSSINDETKHGLAYQEPSLPVLNDKYDDFQNRMPGFAEELKNRKTTRIILWEEYREQVPDGYGRSQFCEHLNRYLELFQSNSSI